MNTTTETEHCGRGLSDEEIVISMTTDSDEHITGEVDVKIRKEMGFVR